MTKTDLSQKYKTRLCKRFHEELHCQYGIRCQFIHNEQPHVKKKQKIQRPIRLLSYNQILAESVKATIVALISPEDPVCFVNPHQTPRLPIFDQVAPSNKKKPRNSQKKKRNINPVEVKREVRKTYPSENHQDFKPN